MNSDVLRLEAKIVKCNKMYEDLQGVKNALKNDLFTTGINNELVEIYDWVTSSYKNNAQIPSKEEFLNLKISINDNYAVEARNRVSNDMNRISTIQRGLVEDLKKLCEE